MPLPIVFDNDLFTEKRWGNVHRLSDDTFQITEQFAPATVTGTINGGFDGTVTLTATGGGELVLTALGAGFDSGFDTSDVIILANVDDAGDLYYFSLTPHNAGEILTFSEHDLGDFAPCYAAGTRLATPGGDRLVEDLRPGDSVSTHDGRRRRVRWIGRRYLDLTRHRDPENVSPILIRASALADGVPARDLVVSPEHAMFITGGLVAARLLLNGTSITRDLTRRRVTWYHVELDTHDILLAEGAPAESYLDTGNRAMFDNADGPVLLHPSMEVGQAERVARSRAPFWDAPSVVEPIWRHLAERAERLGFGRLAASLTTNDPRLTIAAGSQTFRPVSCRDGVYTFVLPPLEGSVRLVSRATAPSTLQPWLTDRRTLGVAVRCVILHQGDDVRTILADHPALVGGWWASEGDGSSIWRWTNGSARLAADFTRPTVVAIEIGMSTTYLLTSRTTPMAGQTALTA